MNISQIKTNKKIAQMSCTAYIVDIFHHHANFGQFKAKHVLSTFLKSNYKKMNLHPRRNFSRYVCVFFHVRMLFVSFFV